MAFAILAFYFTMTCGSFEKPGGHLVPWENVCDTQRQGIRDSEPLSGLLFQNYKVLESQIRQGHERSTSIQSQTLA
jgi:hypothetical protein